MCFFVQTNHTRKELLFLMFKEINLRNHSSLHKLFYSLVESVIQNGNINIIGITEKITNNQFEEVQHTHPAPIDKNNEKRIKETVKKVLKAIGADNCTTHTEIKLTKEGPRIVEVNGRMGGDYINTDLVPLARGINIVRATLQVSLNESIRDAISPKFNKGASVRFIIPSHAGTIKSWKIDKELF